MNRPWPSPAVRRGIADGLTASRWPVVLLLLAGRPSPQATVLLVGWAWLSDALDGPLARTTGRAGRLATFDHPTDAAVGVSLLFHLGDIGFVPYVPARLTAVLLVAVWLATRVLAVQMLLQTVAYTAFLLWAFSEPVAGRGGQGAVLVLIILAILAVQWQRFTRQLVPEFLLGWSQLLTGRFHQPEPP